MRKIFREVLIFCPEYAGGGSEALHQLGYHITRNGGTAYMVYYTPFSTLELDGDVLRCHAGQVPTYYPQYQPQILQETKLRADTLVVFPEVLTHWAAIPTLYQRAVWWLSVDNGMAFNTEMLKVDYRERFFEDSDLVHLHQCDYARTFLQSNRAATYFPLSDYTDQDFVNRSLISSNNPRISDRSNTICYFPNKGAQLAATFIEQKSALSQPVNFLPICEMTKAQVRDALFDARLYIDFGHHPGKDRVPREAAIAGAVVLLHAAGAARHFSDHPLRPDYFFTKDDVMTGRLLEKVSRILENIEMHFDAQRSYRDAILHEREKFDFEVRSYFFTGV